MRCLMAITLAAVAFLIPSCTETGTESDDLIVTTNATALLGLSEDSECEYVQYDSLITYPPLRIYVDTARFSMTVVASDSARELFDLSFDSIKTAALRITSNSIVNLGYFEPAKGQGSLIPFAEPPELFPRLITSEDTWSYYAPPVFGVTDKLFLSWGFEVTRTFDRREYLLLPLGGFNCYVFLCEYSLPGDEESFKTTYEYYAEGYGLVKLYSAGPSGSSRAFMISREGF